MGRTAGYHFLSGSVTVGNIGLITVTFPESFDKIPIVVATAEGTNSNVNVNVFSVSQTQAKFEVSNVNGGTKVNYTAFATFE
jgi:hypothetical protein